MTPSIDGPLTLARRRLDDAVHTLAAPTPVWVDGACRWSPSLYGRLRAALCGMSVRRRGRGQGQRSRLPCSASMLAWLVEVDATVAGWEPHGKTTVERLRQLAVRGWRPQDCRLLDGYSSRLERWSASAVELLAETPSVALELPCPRCEASFAYRRDSGGDRVRVWALRVSETGCECRACGAFWGPERFEWLARLLGCDPVVAV
jgi:hypothetical protein